MTEYRQHVAYDPSILVSDPAYAAERMGLIGNHTDKSVLHKVGAWRWQLLQKHRELIVGLLKNGRAMDFGGAAAPVGYGAIVVDRLAPDKALYDVSGCFDVIICSHILEHIEDWEMVLHCLRNKLHTGGHLVIQSPSWHNERLRGGNWPYHANTLCLSMDILDAKHVIVIDTALNTLGFKIKVAEDDGNNVFVIAALENQ